MTQAFNLSQLANNLNTSGQLDATDGLSGIVPLANGGTGTTNTVNSIVAGTGISTSVSGTQVTINSTVTGGVTSLNGQTGAITNTTFGAIGSYIVAGNKTNLGAGEQTFTQGNTYAGSVLIFTTTALFAGGTGSIAVNSSSYYSSPLTGTWRCMATVRTQQNECTGFRQTPTIYVRVS